MSCRGRESSERELEPEEIIKILRAQPNLKSLDLGCALGGEGSKVLFQWLAYGDDDGVYGESHDKDISLPLPQLSDFNLDGVCLGNVGFSALVGWLERLKKRQETISRSKVPENIRELLLQNNNIEGTSELALAFVSALTVHKMDPPYISSSLCYLNLSYNPLSAEFKQGLFSSLPSLPSLRTLSLNLTGLNQADADALAAYIGQCSLIDFHARANKMGYSGLKKILKAMKRCWTLERVDMHANDAEDNGESESGSSDDEREHPGNRRLPRVSGSGLQYLQSKLQMILQQNLSLKRIVQHQAFELLKYSRLLLLKQHPDHGRSHSEWDLLEESVGQEAPHHSNCIHICECLPTFHKSHSRPPSPVLIGSLHTSNSHFPFIRLPIEIQLIVLSQLAPMLSSSQQVRIFEHAVDKTTLPDISLRFPSPNGGGGILRAASFSFATGGFTRPGIGYSTPGGSSIAASAEKERWLELVGCNAYDPNQ